MASHRDWWGSHTEEEDDPGPKEDFTSQNMVSDVNPRIKPTKLETDQKWLVDFRSDFRRIFWKTQRNLGNNSNYFKIQLKMMHLSAESWLWQVFSFNLSIFDSKYPKNDDHQWFENNFKLIFKTNWIGSLPPNPDSRRAKA